ncbi:MAG TPA: thiamine pyrophosphate-dependent enzyme [Deltaproteobacteria bacterium]|nr:thiamine pyrophosphate-dependent enzyme [Deltaproteobacteria bacterium]
MAERFDPDHPIDIAWCPGCGNYHILAALKSALAELGKDPESLVIVSGIGQAAKTPQYVRTNFFNGLHGRSLPVATAIKATNPGLTVIAESGDGCMYGEGGNHLLHAVRRNPDITVLVHNNMVYGLTKGQASPTSMRGFTTPVQVSGVCVEPMNPLTMAIGLSASFVARAFAGDIEQTREIVKQAITHKGFALVDIFQPCVSFNRVNTYQWYKEHCFYLDGSHDPADRDAAFRVASRTDSYALGVLSIVSGIPTFEECLDAYKGDPRPLHERRVSSEKIEKLMDDKRV